jgi:hypothetical protein
MIKLSPWEENGTGGQDRGPEATRTDAGVQSLPF